MSRAAIALVCNLEVEMHLNTGVLYQSQLHNKANLRDLIAATGLVISN